LKCRHLGGKTDGRQGEMDATIKGAGALRKDVMMAHSLQLLGISASVPAAAASSSSAATVSLHARMFDRPNEKMLFLVLHFLLLKLHPPIEQVRKPAIAYMVAFSFSFSITCGSCAQELKFCWPIITPHDKSNFKRLVQVRKHQIAWVRIGN
jgi:hypothetical protein